MERPINLKPKMNYWLWLGPLLYMVVVGAYFVIRYQGHWVETDTGGHFLEWEEPERVARDLQAFFSSLRR